MVWMRNKKCLVYIDKKALKQRMLEQLLLLNVRLRIVDRWRCESMSQSILKINTPS